MFQQNESLYIKNETKRELSNAIQRHLSSRISAVPLSVDFNKEIDLKLNDKILLLGT